MSTPRHDLQNTTIGALLDDLSWSAVGYRVRRAVCWLRGHKWEIDGSTPEDVCFCARCMTENE